VVGLLFKLEREASDEHFNRMRKDAFKVNVEVYPVDFALFARAKLPPSHLRILRVTFRD